MVINSIVLNEKEKWQSGRLVMLQRGYDLDHRAQQQQGILQKLGTRVNSFSAILVSSILSAFYLSPAQRSQNINSERSLRYHNVRKETNAEGWPAIQCCKGTPVPTSFIALS